MTDLTFPFHVAEFEGHTLTIEMSDGKDHHPSPPGYLEVWLRRPDGPDGKPGGHMSNQAICRFFKNFNGDEEITQTQAERNQLKKDLAEARQDVRADKKEIGELKRRVAELEAELAKDRALVRNELARTKIAALQRAIVPEADPKED